MAYSIYHLHRAVNDIAKYQNKAVILHPGLFYLGSIFPESYVLPNSSLTRDDLHLLFPYTGQQADDMFFAVKKLHQKYNWNFKNPEELSFYLGYCHHLILDAVYALELYKPFFGKETKFSQGPLYHDVFRIYLDTFARSTYTNHQILANLKEAKIDFLTDFFPKNVIKAWQSAVYQQLSLMPDVKKVLLLFIGEEQRFKQTALQYDQVISQITKIITPKHIVIVENQVTELFDTFYQERSLLDTQ